jgi:hypothetical protein
MYHEYWQTEVRDNIIDIFSDETDIETVNPECIYETNVGKDRRDAIQMEEIQIEEYKEDIIRLINNDKIKSKVLSHNEIKLFSGYEDYIYPLSEDKKQHIRSILCGQ